MRIGIDIDGTITTPFYWLDFFNKQLGKNKRPKEITTYDHHLAFDMNLLAFDAFRSTHLEHIHNLATPRYEAEYYVNKLYFEHHETCIITAREKLLEPLTFKWLSKYNINYHSLYHLGSTQKVYLALNLKLDVFIEDRLETALAMIKWQIPTILFNTPYNQGLDHPLIQRVDTWEDAYNFIAILSKTDSKKVKSI